MQNREEDKEDIINEKNHLKQIFLAEMSHELRTPMSAILGFSSLLMQSDLDENQYKFTQSIYEAADDLLVIINDVLDYSKIESGVLNIYENDFNLRELLYKLAQKMNRKVRDNQPGFTLSIDEKLPDFLKGDVQKVEQILMHLMNSALRFTTQKQIELHVLMQGYKEKCIEVKFELKNTGIPKKNAFAIFNEPGHLGTRSMVRHFGGSGLDFFIVKKLGQLLGGNIYVSTGQETSTDLIGEFRFGVGKSSQIPETLEGEFSLEDIQVLVCEDNILSQELTREILHRLGCKVTIVGNGQQGLEKLQQAKKPYDLVLMDIQMPVMNGLQATTAIRQLDSMVKDIPVIALTAQLVEEEKEKYLEVGISDYLTKPLTPESITQKIVRFLSDKTTEATNGVANHQMNGRVNIVSHTLFDLNFLKDAFGDNPAIFQELLQALTHQFLQFKRNVSNGLHLHDWKRVAQAAQVIKVNLRAFGLKSLEEKVSLVEQHASDQQRLEEIPTLIRDCEEIFAGAIKELNSLLKDKNII